MGALTSLEWLTLSQNQLTGPIPDMSLLTKLTVLDLCHNELTGLIPDLSFLINLTRLELSHNELTGPVPDLSDFTSLTAMRLTDNQFCLPSGCAISDANPEGTFHLKKLNLPTCTKAELSVTRAVPLNLTPTVGVGQVTLSWGRAANAATYELRTWDSIERQWGPIGGVLTGTSFTHSVRTDGRNYYYQVRSRDADGVRSAWSERVYAAVVSTFFSTVPRVPRL